MYDGHLDCNKTAKQQIVFFTGHLRPVSITPYCVNLTMTQFTTGKETNDASRGYYEAS